MSENADWPGDTRLFGRRHLTAEEEQLWSIVRRSVRPLRSKKAHRPTPRHKAPKPAPRPAATRPDPTVASLAAPAMVFATAGRTPVPPAPIALARRDKQQLSRGRAAIDARIDLHGMTQAQAHGALLRFLAHCQADGAKFALVITGKGAPDAPPDARGVLRRQVPLWLSLAQFRVYVLGFAIANAGHGGEGALYLQLRRPRHRP
jgi:DNA-nicking Smr family endonuclease